jgi:hypothetical protein
VLEVSRFMLTLRMCRYEELPEWAKDNHFVVRGYRRISYSYASCVKSIFA